MYFLSNSFDYIKWANFKDLQQDDRVIKPLSYTLYFNEISERFSASHTPNLLPLDCTSGSFNSSLSISVTWPHWSAQSAEKWTTVNDGDLKICYIE